MVQRVPFVDPHVHLWDLAHIRYPWLAPPFSDDNPNGSVEPIARDYPLDAYLADAAKWEIAGIVHVDAGAHPEDALKETAWLQAMSDADRQSGRGLPTGIVAYATLHDPDVEALLAAHVEHANVRGIRHIINWHPDPRRSYSDADATLDPAWETGFGLLAKYGLSFDLQAYSNQFDHLAALIARHPDTQVVLDHTGMMTGDADHEQWRAGMEKLAALPNVATKISGMGFAWRPWSVEQARPYVLETIELFGVERSMFASNFPTDKLFGSFDQHLGAYEAITADFAESERRALFAGNANRIYRLGLSL